jgi:hypothetical protein
MSAGQDRAVARRGDSEAERWNSWIAAMGIADVGKSAGVEVSEQCTARRWSVHIEGGSNLVSCILTPLLKTRTDDELLDAKLLHRVDGGGLVGLAPSARGPTSSPLLQPPPERHHNTSKTPARSRAAFLPFPSVLVPHPADHHLPLPPSEPPCHISSPGVTDVPF